MPPNDIPLDERTLGFAVLMLGEALRASLEALGAQHDQKPGEWLSTLEAEAVRRAKGVVAEGIPEQDEAIAAKNALAIVELHFEQFRERLGGRGA